MSKVIVLVASPEVRTLCPPEFIEGQWREIPDDAEEIVMGILGQDDVVARPNGKMQRRDDGVTAPVWEIRRNSQI
jgi:hypothetical protein